MSRNIYTCSHCGRLVAEISGAEVTVEGVRFRFDLAHRKVTVVCPDCQTPRTFEPPKRVRWVRPRELASML